MATANELLHDAVIRRQVALQHYAPDLTLQIVRLLDSTEAQMRETLKTRLAGIVTGQGIDFGPVVTARLNVILQALEQIRTHAFTEAGSVWQDQLTQLSASEANYVKESFSDSIDPIQYDLVLPSAAQLAGIVTSQPFQGKILSEWADGLQTDELDRIGKAIRIGLVQGNTTDEISRSVFGSGYLNGADGVLEVTRRNADAITRTAINHVSNEARGAVLSANSDLFDMEQYVAVLDSRTTEICAALDGQQFKVGEGPTPPLHWNCRSARVAVIDAQGLIGTRASNASLDGMTDEEVDAKIGQVPAKTTYQEFLTRQTEAFQTEVLGATRQQLFADGGLTLDKFVNFKTAQPYTLAELQRREPAAFRRAGI